MAVDFTKTIQNSLNSFLARFAGCFRHVAGRAHLKHYVEGQLSDLDRKNCETIALMKNIPPRNLQEFLASAQWDEDLATQRIHEIVAQRKSSALRIGIIDETSDLKKGTKTPGVKRQHLGCVGKTDNGIVSVHLVFAQNDFHCVLRGELFLPKEWSEDRDRCRAAGIPEEMVHKPKPAIALDQIDLSREQDVDFDAVTFDEGYGRSKPFLRGLDARGLVFAGEIPSNFHAWTEKPPVTERVYKKSGKGRGRTKKRLRSDAKNSRTVKETVAKHPAFHGAWKPFLVKETEKGPLVWEAVEIDIWIKDEKGLPVEKPLRLVAARNVLNREEIKYFVSNAPSHRPLSWLLHVGFSRWHVERCFEDQKQEIGWDDYQGRLYQGLKRHFILSNVSYLFLSQMREELRPSLPEITVCQIQDVLRTIFRWCPFGGSLAKRDRDQLNKKLDYYSRRHASARRSHRKKRVSELMRVGVDVERLESCRPENSST